MIAISRATCWKIYPPCSDIADPFYEAKWHGIQRLRPYTKAGSSSISALRFCMCFPYFTMKILAKFERDWWSLKKVDFSLAHMYSTVLVVIKYIILLGGEKKRFKIGFKIEGRTAGQLINNGQRRTWWRCRWWWPLAQR